VRANSGPVSVGTAGIGSDDHLLMIGLDRAAGIRLNHIPFAGQAPTVTALRGGHMQVASMNMGKSMGLIRNGRVRPLASVGAERFPMTPDVPTFLEAGYALDTRVVRSRVVPAATPQPIREPLAAMLAATMRDRAWIAEAERSDRHHRVLRCERSIEQRHDQPLDGAEGLGLRPLRGGHAFEPRQIGKPDQEQRCLDDGPLFGRDCGKPGLARRVFNRDRAPGLQVR
jgi:hypothetical protein